MNILCELCCLVGGWGVQCCAVWWSNPSQSFQLEGDNVQVLFLFSAPQSAVPCHAIAWHSYHAVHGALFVKQALVGYACLQTSSMKHRGWHGLPRGKLLGMQRCSVIQSQV